MGVEKREVNALVKGGDKLGCGDLLVITCEYEGEEMVKVSQDDEECNVEHAMLQKLPETLLHDVR